MGGALGFFSSLASFITGLLVVLLVPIYLVAQPEPAVRFFARCFPPERRGQVREVLSEVRSGLLSWLKGRLVSMAVVAVLATVALYIKVCPGRSFWASSPGFWSSCRSWARSSRRYRRC